jgi:T5SS/PEP-CTERM-associated repeat protein
MSACIRKELSLSWPVAVAAFAAIVIACPTQTFAASSGAQWNGGIGVWSDSALWFCSGPIANKQGHCVPTGSVDVFIGNGGGVTLNMNASTASLQIGNGSSLSVGAGASLMNSETDILGESGSGRLMISGGGSESDGILTELGLEPETSGMVTVTGKGSQWKTGDVYVGGLGDGSLTISDGGAVSSRFAAIGTVSGVGTVTVTGSGTQWKATGLAVGVAGLGQLFVEQGGVVNVTGSAVSLGGFSKSNGDVTVTGLESQINASSAKVYVGEAGTGTLTLNKSATGSSLDLDVGVAAGGMGAVTLNGTGTKWVNGAGTVTLGDAAGTSKLLAAAGALTVEDGATLSTLNEVVGNSGVGTFTLSGGSNTLTGDLTLGAKVGGAGTYNLSGTGSLTLTGLGLSEVIGNEGTGYFSQTGGTNTTPSLEVAAVSSKLLGFPTNLGSETYSLSGDGHLDAGSEILGLRKVGDIFMGNQGVFDQTGGTNRTGNLVVGENGSS